MQVEQTTDHPGSGPLLLCGHTACLAHTAHFAHTTHPAHTTCLALLCFCTGPTAHDALRASLETLPNLAVWLQQAACEEHNGPEHIALATPFSLTRQPIPPAAPTASAPITTPTSLHTAPGAGPHGTHGGWQQLNPTGPSTTVGSPSGWSDTPHVSPVGVGCGTPVSADNRFCGGKLLNPAASPVLGGSFTPTQHGPTPAPALGNGIFPEGGRAAAERGPGFPVGRELTTLNGAFDLASPSTTGGWSDVAPLPWTSLRNTASMLGDRKLLGGVEANTPSSRHVPKGGVGEAEGGLWSGEQHLPGSQATAQSRGQGVVGGTGDRAAAHALPVPLPPRVFSQIPRQPLRSGAAEPEGGVAGSATNASQHGPRPGTNMAWASNQQGGAAAEQGVQAEGVGGGNTWLPRRSMSAAGTPRGVRKAGGNLPAAGHGLGNGNGLLKRNSCGDCKGASGEDEGENGRGRAWDPLASANEGESRKGDQGGSEVGSKGWDRHPQHQSTPFFNSLPAPSWGGGSRGGGGGGATSPWAGGSPVPPCGPGVGAESISAAQWGVEQGRTETPRGTSVARRLDTHDMWQQRGWGITSCTTGGDPVAQPLVTAGWERCHSGAPPAQLGSAGWEQCQSVPGAGAVGLRGETEPVVGFVVQPERWQAAAIQVSAYPGGQAVMHV